MENLASIFLHSRTQAHEFHLRVKGTGSLALHKALQEYYESIIPLLDGLIEAYQGQFGVIEFKQVNGVDNNASKENIIAYFSFLPGNSYHILVKAYLLHLVKQFTEIREVHAEETVKEIFSFIRDIDKRAGLSMF